MSIVITNSITKKKEELQPIKAKNINMYSCGVTVYDRCHIGHARSLYIFDVIRRYLKHQGFKVNFIRNITDIDDKIINKANELGLSAKEVSENNIKSYYEDLNALEVNRADVEPKATESIPDMIVHIEKLIGKGHAYASDGDVYFSVRSFKDYGKLSGQSVDKMLEGVRIDKGEKKKDSLDFALWKKSKEGEPSWTSPWGEGRPGWHIECSVMSMKYLKCETLDIHAGGRDLIFPHHENEIAQSEALTGKPFAKYWIHHGLLTIDGQKMAKSVGNFITIEDALKKYSADELKFFFLSSHYASPIDFSEEKMADMRKNIERFKILNAEAKNTEASKDGRNLPPEIEKQRQEFMAAMDDDFNTPRALACFFEMVTLANKAKDNVVLSQANGLIQSLARDVLGLSMDFEEKALATDEEKLLEERAQARKNKDFKRSDELRDILKEKGIIVEDGKEGQTWRRS
ncbi:MAG: cysteine--tRNA ligase [Candidatus Aceula meridiana]|nr:cysteine--tRNA ligase [Candidatus Aceula meridiana]